jgi:hypothetical protein
MLTITVAAASVVPVITSPAINPTGTVGTVFPSYPIVATGSPTSYTATGLPSGLTIDPLTGVINGTPTGSGTFVVTITATNITGTATTTLTIVVAPQASWISSFSGRGITGQGDELLILGFEGVGDNATYLVRAVGPTLASFNVPNVLSNPTLALYDSAGGNPIAANDAWQVNLTGAPDATAIIATSAAAGAYPLPNGSNDSALLVTLNTGGYTAEVAGANGTVGTSIAEVYDTDLTPGDGILAGSVRGNIASNGGVLIAGVYISGSTPKTLLIIGLGPTLGTYGVPNGRHPDSGQ